MRLAFFKLKIIVLLLFLFKTQSLIAQESAKFDRERYYVAIENISVCKDGILILGGESLILVKNLFHDEQGFYFLDADECGWICNWCGAINPLDASTCNRCGEGYGSRPSKKRRK